MPRYLRRRTSAMRRLGLWQPDEEPKRPDSIRPTLLLLPEGRVRA